MSNVQAIVSVQRVYGCHAKAESELSTLSIGNLSAKAENSWQKNIDTPGLLGVDVGMATNQEK
jgi:hypothetical protein